MCVPVHPIWHNLDALLWRLRKFALSLIRGDIKVTWIWWHVDICRWFSLKIPPRRPVCLFTWKVSRFARGVDWRLRCCRKCTTLIVYFRSYQNTTKISRFVNRKLAQWTSFNPVNPSFTFILLISPNSIRRAHWFPQTLGRGDRTLLTLGTVRYSSTDRRLWAHPS